MFEPSCRDWICRDRPDIYFVNEDAVCINERMTLFEEAGLDVKVVVARRKPTEGLEARSSTDMKARLRETILKDEVLSSGWTMLLVYYFGCNRWRASTLRSPRSERGWVAAMHVARLRASTVRIFVHCHAVWLQRRCGMHSFARAGQGGLELCRAERGVWYVCGRVGGLGGQMDAPVGGFLDCGRR